jgi:hypothetical protein
MVSAVDEKHQQRRSFDYSLFYSVRRLTVAATYIEPAGFAERY